MLDDVGDVHVAGLDSRFGECVIQQPPRRSHERMAFQILAIAGLLADQHDRRAGASFAEYRLRGSLVQAAAAAYRCRLAQCRQGGARRQKVRRAPRTARRSPAPLVAERYSSGSLSGFLCRGMAG